MSLSPVKESLNLSGIARETFDAALSEVDPARAVQNAVRIAGALILAGRNRFDTREVKSIYSVALGKAAAKMAAALSDILGDKLAGGVVSAPNFHKQLPDVWQRFIGGHPVPDEQSVAAARAAFGLLKRANEANSLVVFLVSGGGSAMMELPAAENISLTDLRVANGALVNCGATISEINAVRRRFSMVKGGGLKRAAEDADQITLIVSDTNEGEAFNVASGPTIVSENDLSNAEIADVLRRYGLSQTLPPTVLTYLSQSSSTIRNPNFNIQDFEVLLENTDVLKAVELSLRKKGFAVETAADLVESPIEEGCRKLVERLSSTRTDVSPGKPTAIVSGGEFVCPVRGNGRGGRNTEAALRTAILFDTLKSQNEFLETNFVVLFAGTDGIDGNSPAAGAICDETTIDRGRAKNLDPWAFLETSDSYSFFAALGDQIEIGATGTNVRDVRILLAH